MEINYNRNALSMTGIIPVSTDQQIVNEQVYINKDDIEINTQAITSLDIRVSSLEIDVGQIAINTADIASLDGRVSQNETDIAQLQTDVGLNTSNIQANTNAISNINTDIAELTLLEASIDVNTIDIVNLQSIGTNWVYNNSYGNPFRLTGYNQLFA
jgi:hypothetical protein